jgi:hypothetical protein
MSRKSVAAGGIAFAALLLVLGVLVSKGAPPTPTEDAEFHGKVVLVVLKTDRGSNLLLQNVHV